MSDLNYVRAVWQDKETLIFTWEMDIGPFHVCDCRNFRKSDGDFPVS